MVPRDYTECILNIHVCVQLHGPKHGAGPQYVCFLICVCTLRQCIMYAIGYHAYTLMIIGKLNLENFHFFHIR